jgi:hypothetical protein
LAYELQAAKIQQKIRNEEIQIMASNIMCIEIMARGKIKWGLDSWGTFF